MDDKTLDNIQSKIKKLLAMAEHPNSNENEAAIRDRLAKPLADFAAGIGNALVVCNTGLVKEAINRVYPRLGTSRGFAPRGIDGQTAGRAAGRDMRLSPQRKLTGTMMLGGSR